MNLFYHHVGQTGAAEDFKKTIYSNVTYELVERNIPAHVPILGINNIRPQTSAKR
jgi:hypothetical protein